MERTEKCFYEAPVTKVFTVAQERVICASGETEQFRNGGSYGNDDFI